MVGSHPHRPAVSTSSGYAASVTQVLEVVAEARARLKAVAAEQKLNGEDPNRSSPRANPRIRSKINPMHPFPNPTAKSGPICRCRIYGSGTIRSRSKLIREKYVPISTGTQLAT